MSLLIKSSRDLKGGQMYLFDVPRVNYADPWLIPFNDRFKHLIKGQFRVAYYYDHPDNSTFRYRVYNMIQTLEESQSDISSSYFCYDDLPNLNKVIDIADVIVICRSKYTDELNRLITRARSKDKLVFFDIDDLVFDPAYIHLVLDTLDQDLTHPNVWDFWFAYVGRQGATLNLCDRVITTNEFLASQLHSYCKKPVSVIPNFLNKEQIEISKQIFISKKGNGFSRNKQIHLGYFSGTPSHNKDLEVVADSLAELLRNYPNIVLRIVGFIQLKKSLEEYRSRIEFFPLQDFINLQRLIGEVELNLVPLQDNIFTNCKSELKYFEAGIVGTVSMASPIFTYKKAIRDNENGYLAKSFEWQDKLISLIDEIEACPDIAEKAYIDSEQKYAWYNQAALIKDVLFPST
jgi:glycosyltransferase involved in cell wall biosynthesis